MVQFKEVLVTPKLAKEYISRNSHNRTLKADKVLLYANDILEGKWKRNTAEPIKIATSGRILDGNHRLHAVVKSNLPVHFTIATGLKEDVFDVLDTGTSRSNGDVFDIAGIKNARLVPAIIQSYIRLSRGRVDKSMSGSQN